MIFDRQLNKFWGSGGVLARVHLPGLNFMCGIFSTLMSLNNPEELLEYLYLIR